MCAGIGGRSGGLLDVESPACLPSRPDYLRTPTTTPDPLVRALLERTAYAQIYKTEDIYVVAYNGQIQVFGSRPYMIRRIPGAGRGAQQQNALRIEIEMCSHTTDMKFGYVLQGVFNFCGRVLKTHCACSFLCKLCSHVCVF